MLRHETVVSVDSRKVAHPNWSMLFSLLITCTPQMKNTEHTTRKIGIYLIHIYYLLYRYILLYML